MDGHELIEPIPQHTSDRLSRRAVRGGTGIALVAAVAACIQSGTTPQSVPDPVALDGGKQGDQGGTVIGDHSGPSGQLFYRDHSPEGRDNPAWFHALTAG